jgi:hypothetical protein
LVVVEIIDFVSDLFKFKQQEQTPDQSPLSLWTA